MQGRLESYHNLADRQPNPGLTTLVLDCFSDQAHPLPGGEGQSWHSRNVTVQ